MCRPSASAIVVSSFLIACLSVSLLARPPRAGTPPAQETMNFSLEGKITQHAGNRLTVNTQGNIVFRVVYSEKTSITRKDGSAGTSKDIPVGTRIFVEGDLTESGEIIAQKISIRPDASEKKP